MNEAEAPQETISVSTITIPKALRNDLELLKIIPQEPWYSVIQRLVNEHNAKPSKKK